MQIETYKLKGWEDKETGLLIAENEDWILVKHIPIDYQIDGYKLYAKQFVKKRKSHKDQELIKRVLELKQIAITPPTSFTFTAIAELLKWSETAYGFFEFQEKKQSELFYGKLHHLHENTFMIDQVLADGTLEKAYAYDFSLSKIRSINFESDYFESLRLLMHDVNND